MRILKMILKYFHYKIALRLLDWYNRPPKILKYPHRKLRKISEPIDFEKTSQKELVKIFRKLFAALQSQPYGDRLGIAAPQIGVNKRIMIIEGAPMINPEWKAVNGQVGFMVEACYSLPKGDVYRTTRPKYGWASWYNINGEFKKFKLNGMRAVVFQHELDHLDGKCLPNYGEKIKVKI